LTVEQHHYGADAVERLVAAVQAPL